MYNKEKELKERSKKDKHKQDDKRGGKKGNTSHFTDQKKIEKIILKMT
jgi:hypothetical protein